MTEDKKRRSIDILAKKLREQTGNTMSHEDAKKRIIKAVTKKGG